jgi:hypothetical protein
MPWNFCGRGWLGYFIDAQVFLVSQTNSASILASYFATDSANNNLGST